jgi:hypothetical protein
LNHEEEMENEDPAPGSDNSHYAHRLNLSLPSRTVWCQRWW